MSLRFLKGWNTVKNMWTWICILNRNWELIGIVLDSVFRRTPPGPILRIMLSVCENVDQIWQIYSKSLTLKVTEYSTYDQIYFLWKINLSNKSQVEWVNFYALLTWYIKTWIEHSFYYVTQYINNKYITFNDTRLLRDSYIFSR